MLRKAKRPIQDAFFRVLPVLLAWGALALPIKDLDAAPQSFIECVQSGVSRELASKRIPWTESNKQKALEIIVTGSQSVSRTVTHGRRFMAPESVADHQITEIAESNFQKAAKYVLDHFEQLELNENTAILINKILTEKLVQEKDRGNSNFRLRGTYTHQMDSFAGRLPATFYRWLESEAAHQMWLKDPIEFAEVVHNNLVSLDSFPDGNGRLSRLFADLALIKAGLAPALYTDMTDYFNRGNARAPVSRKERIQYFREIVRRGQLKFQDQSSVEAEPLNSLIRAIQRRGVRPWSLNALAVCDDPMGRIVE